jgi:dolichol-phosphate mannosyltransferase
LQITVVIPTYNEAENLSNLVSALVSLPLDLRVQIVDDNSPDGTGQIADEIAKKDQRVRVHHRVGKIGFGSAYLSGFRIALEAGSEAILQMDADFSHEPSIIPTMAALLERCDAVIGSRYVSGGSVDERWPLWRKSLSSFGNYYARSILRLPVRDVTTGFRLWRRETLLGMPLERIQANGYVFQVELAYLACCLDYKVCELPIYFPDRRWGKSKMSFKIQVEAALRVWSVLWSYRDVRRSGKSGRR